MQLTDRGTAVALALILGVASSAPAQGAPVKVTEDKPGLFKLAKVTAEAATKTAQAVFPTGTIKTGELEKEAGKLIYTFDIQQPGVKGTEEVHVDAMTGEVIKKEHENPAPPKVKPVKKPPIGTSPAL